MASSHHLLNEEIFVNIFCSERFFENRHIPHFLNTFASEYAKSQTLHKGLNSSEHNEGALSEPLHKSAAATTHTKSTKDSDSKAVDSKALDGKAVDSKAEDSKALDSKDLGLSLVPLPYLEDERFIAEMTRLSANLEHEHLSLLKGEIKPEVDYFKDGERMSSSYVPDEAREPTPWPVPGANATLCYLKKPLDKCVHESRLCLEEDRLKLTMSAPLRRLQQKTQVFPLDVNASSRSRLTHSYEVAAHAKLTISAMVEKVLSLRPFMYEMMVAVENAAFMHDLGNPPFGHFGEQVIRLWLKSVCEHHEHVLTAEQIADLEVFNGNAQGLRLLHSIYELNLTLGQISAFIKVPYSYKELEKLKENAHVVRSHAGYFLSESPVIEKIRSSMMGAKRHPLSLIMEQCDDLSYALADLEDAYDRGVLKELEIYELISNLVDFLKDKMSDESSTAQYESQQVTMLDDNSKLELELEPELQAYDLAAILQDSLWHLYKMQDSAICQHEVKSVELSKVLKALGVREVLSVVRECLTTYYIKDIVDTVSLDLKAFITLGQLNLQDSGRYLLAHQAITFLKRFEQSHVYTHHEVEQLELKGAAYLKEILKIYSELLNLSLDDFKRCLIDEKGDIFACHLMRRIARRYKKAYLKLCQFDEENPSLEMYARIRLIVDYVSSMTDTFAAREFATLTGGAAF